MSNYNLVLYGSGLFGNNNNPTTNQQQCTAVRNSGFSTVILWTLHVHNNGDFYYNNTAIVQSGAFSEANFHYLPPLVRSLKTGGTVNKVLFCIGSADAGDYRGIAALLQTRQGRATLQKNFSALIQALPLDGFDFDLEEFDQDYTATIIGLSLMLSRDLNAPTITYCPYNEEDFWFNCLAEVYDQNNGQQVVRWMNLQCYAGGGNNDPDQWVADLQAYSKQTAPLGISDANAFIVAGYDAGDQPAGIKQDFSGKKIQGGFIWNSTEIFQSGSTPVDYAQAVAQGLGGS
jgi:hypothetical protein